MFKYLVHIDGEPGFTVDMEEPVNTGDFIHNLGYFLVVTSKTFFIDEAGKNTAVLMAEYHDEDEEDDDEDGIDDTSFVPDNDDLDSFCIPHD